MWNATRLIVVGLAVALTATCLSPDFAAGQTQPDRWRYTYSGGQWWYWMPEGRWVFWRDNHWNNYCPPAASSPAVNGYSALAPANQFTAPAYGSLGGIRTDMRPFYGHTLGSPEYRPYSGDDIQPFYGHALPGRLFGSWGWGGFDAGPFYGHAAGD